MTGLAPDGTLQITRNRDRMRAECRLAGMRLQRDEDIAPHCALADADRGQHGLEHRLDLAR